MRMGSWLLAAASCLLLATGAFAHGKPKIVLGIVAKSQSNPVFQAATNQGAPKMRLEGTREAQYGVDVEVNIQTPPEEDAQKQAQAVAQLASSGVAGIAVSCSNANTLQTAIDKAVEGGVPVICFDSDSPKSKRFAYYGTDDTACGTKVAVELAKVMGDKGNVVILAGNQSAPNLQTRAKAVRDEMAKHPGIKIIDTVYHEETLEKAGGGGGG